MPALLPILKMLLTTVIGCALKHLPKLINSAMLAAFKALLLKHWKSVLLILISMSVGCLIGWYLLPPKVVTQVETKTVTEYVNIPTVKEVLPPLPECAGFDFNPAIGGLSGSELIAFTASLYQWSANCSSKLSKLQE